MPTNNNNVHSEFISYYPKSLMHIHSFDLCNKASMIIFNIHLLIFKVIFKREEEREKGGHRYERETWVICLPRRALT